MAIEGYVGRPGSGKSYTLVERALREAARGRDVFCNFQVDGTYYFEPDQLLDLPPGLIIIDEAHLWFPSRMSLKLPPAWLAMLSQTRKNGWDLLWSAQHETRVDRIVRDVSSWIWVCSAWGQNDGHPLLFRAECYEPENMRNPKKRAQQSVRLFSPKVAAAYNTFERIVVAEHATSTNDAYAPKSSARRGGSVLDGIFPEAGTA